MLDSHIQKNMVFMYSSLYHEPNKYFSIKINHLSGENSNEIMVSIIDASDHIKFKNEKQNNELQKTINATVNHELRNPLNSIVAVNEQNKKSIEKIKQIAQN